MKKLILKYLALCAILSTVISCSKDENLEGTAALTIINMLPGADLIATSFTEPNDAKIFSYTNMAKYGIYEVNNNRRGIPAKQQPLSLYRIPDTLDRNKPLYHMTLTPAPNEISTLFLMGTLEQPDQLTLKGTPPYYAVTDSVMGIRFVNLSFGSQPLKIKISGPTVNLTHDNLVYKGVSDYAKVSTKSNAGDLKIEVYNPTSATPIISYSLNEVGVIKMDNKWRFRNFTFVIYGLPDASNPKYGQNALMLNDF